MSRFDSDMLLRSEFWTLRAFSLKQLEGLVGKVVYV